MRALAEGREIDRQEIMMNHPVFIDLPGSVEFPIGRMLAQSLYRPLPFFRCQPVCSMEIEGDENTGRRPELPSLLVAVKGGRKDVFVDHAVHIAYRYVGHNCGLRDSKYVR